MIKADLHTHTLACSHAYSTVFELLQYAKIKNLEIIAITDHAPEMPDAPNLWHFKNLRTLPRDYEGVKVLRGVEANIKDFDGRLDIPPKLLKGLDWIIASFHEDALPAGDEKQNSNAWIEVAKNPYVDLIGHPDRLPFVFDHEKVIKVFREYDKIVEINNHSFNMKKWNIKDLESIIKTCKKYDVEVMANSDAHTCFQVGEVTKALNILNEFSYKKDLILNYDPDRIIEKIENKRGKIFTI